ncbi:MAG: cupin domain-containing protein [Bacteroidales bacterium]|jgi:mannose-6-phosphate isomerase-like protein (cupin superfamily)|nr:cupin domain-containing protein [Bacteroidales bacterium]MDD4385604.1 cupin domain-containing protein [Bacteroidales bacterium]MDY0196780.1 cupin domain-containing protein [Tenuifilaceae bacterium]
MKVKTLTTAEKVPFNLDGRKMYIGLDAELIHLSLKPGEVLEKHSNPFDVVFYILEGSGIVETDDEAISVESDMSIEIEREINRGITNTGEDLLRLLVLKIL